MSASAGLHCFPESVFEHALRHGVRVAAGRRDGKRPSSWLADLSCLPAWLLVGHTARHEVARWCGEEPAMFQRYALPDGLWLVRLGNARYLLGAQPEAAVDWTHLPDRVATLPVVLPAESAQFALGGQAALGILRELCDFDPEVLAQPEAYVPLLVAHHEAALLREGDTFILRAAAADGDSLGRALASALTARGGHLIGYDDYQRLRKGASS